MKTLVLALFSLLFVVGLGITPSQISSPSLGGAAFAKPAIGGTIESIDPAGLRVTIMTDSGQKESFPITKVSVLVGVIEGERVWCEMNEDGKVTKIVKATPVPEGSPATEPKG